MRRAPKTLVAGLALGLLLSACAREPTHDRCDALAAEATAEDHRPQVFAEVPGDPPAWRAFPSRGDLERQTAGGDLVVEQAAYWKGDDGTFVSIFLTSPSGDWSLSVEYCFLDGDKLTRSVADLLTFNVNADSEAVRRTRTRHFAPDGSVLRTTTEVVDVDTGKETDVSFVGPEEPVYRSVSELPFAQLLQ